MAATTPYRKLADRFEEVRAQHTRRNRLDGAIYDLLNASMARRQAAPREAVKLHVLEAAMWELLGDPARALASTAAATRGADRRTADRMRSHAALLVGKVRQRFSNHELPGDTRESRNDMVRAAVHELYRSDPESETAKDLWCAYLAETRKLDVLAEFAQRDYVRAPSGRSLNRLLTSHTLKFNKTGEWSHIRTAIGAIAADTDSAADGAALGLSLSVVSTALASHAPEALRHEVTAEAGLQPLAIYTRGPAGTRASQAARRKQIWVNVFENDEALKRGIVDDMVGYISRSQRPSGGVLWNTLLKATSTKTFWSDDAYRDAVTGAVRERLPARGGDSLHVWCRAALHTFAGEMTQAEALFEQARQDEAMQRTIERSGAVTFMAAAHGDLAAYDTEDPLFGRARPITFGSLPEPARSGPALLACADPVFFLRHAESYVETLRRAGSDAPVHFHLAGDNEDVQTLAGSLAQRLGGVSLSTEKPPIRKPYYYATMRFVRLPLLQEALGRDILLTDIDVTFHGRPEEMFENPRLRQSDAAVRVYDAVRVFQRKLTPSLIYRYPRLLPWSHVNAACLAIRATPGGRRLAEIIAAEAIRHIRHVMPLETPVWLIDQTALFAAIRNTHRLVPEIRLGNVEDIGMPFGSFAKVQPESSFPPVGHNPYLF